MRKWLRDPVPEIPEIPEIQIQDPLSDPAQAISGICGISGRSGRPEDDLVSEGSAPASAGGDVSTNITGSRSANITSSSDIIGSPDITGSGAITGATDITGSGAAVVGAGTNITGPTPIIAPRRPQGDEWHTEDWLGLYDEKAAISEFDHGLSRQEAEELAREHCIAEWLYRHPISSKADDGCLICGATDQPNHPLLPIGIAGAGQAWLHIGCSTVWSAARKAEAIAALAAIGIGSPGGNPP
jgi:hypothetical protein